MASADDILQVTERLYAAAAAPDQWRPALEGLANLMHGSHAILDMHGTEPVGAPFRATARLDERDLARAHSPDALRHITPLVDAMPLGLFTRAAVISDAEFERSAVYNEVFRPLNGFRSLHFRQNGTSGAFLLTVCRPHRAEDFDATGTAALQALVPHFKTALALQSRLQTAELRYSGLAQVLDRLDSGVIVTDAAARPLHVNAHAARIAAEADGLTLDDDALAAGSTQATK